MTRIDRLDAEIIGRLTGNARRGIAEIAVDLGVSRNTVQHRIRRLEETGIISGFRPSIDLAAVGLPVQALVSLELNQRSLHEVIAKVAAMPNVLEARTQAGRDDLLVLVAAASVEDLQELTGSMVHIPGVRHTTTTLSVSTPVPFRVQPLLDHVTRQSGWGRSTPSPESD